MALIFTTYNMFYDCSWKVTKFEDPVINSSKNIAKKKQKKHIKVFQLNLRLILDLIMHLKYLKNKFAEKSLGGIFLKFRLLEIHGVSRPSF